MNAAFLAGLYSKRGAAISCRITASGVNGNPKLGLTNACRGIRSANTWRALCSRTPIKIDGDGYVLKSEQVKYERYKTIYDRVVTYPDGAEYSFDVEGSPRANFCSVLVFPFDSATKTTVLIREYHPGLHALRFGFVAGFFNPAVHVDEEAAARAELSEEAELSGGKLLRMNTSAAVPRDKYSKDFFHMFLALDAALDSHPGKRDDEERIDIVRDVPVNEAIDMVYRGEFNLSSATLCLMAAEKLRSLNLL